MTQASATAPVATAGKDLVGQKTPRSTENAMALALIGASAVFLLQTPTLIRFIQGNRYLPPRHLKILNSA